jgi:predicted transcriptional regulator
MPRSARKKSSEKSPHRLSVSLSPDQHAELLEIAHKNKVSVAWVVREAIERLLHDEQPLFHVRQPR